MANPKPDNSKPRNHFGRVKAARAKMEERAAEYVELHLKGCEKAIARGDTSGVQWALSHIEDVEGNRPIGASIDKPAAQIAGSAQPQILIGVSIGRALPEPFIDVESVPTSASLDLISPQRDPLDPLHPIIEPQASEETDK